MKIIKIDYSGINEYEYKNKAQKIYESENKHFSGRQKLGTSYSQNAHKTIQNGIFAEEIFSLAYPKYERSNPLSFLPFDFKNYNQSLIDLKTMNIKGNIERIINNQQYFLQAASPEKLRKYAEMNNINLSKCIYVIGMLNENEKILTLIFSTNFTLSKIFELEPVYEMPKWSGKTGGLKPILNYKIDYFDDTDVEYQEIKL